jgi:fermentation-respiration switch protein FrsA (DUF1100 family)
MVLKLLVTVLACYVMFTACVYFFQDRMLYYPFRELDCTPLSTGFDFVDVGFQAEDGTDLHGWYVPAPQARGVLLFCHGNAGNISHRLDSISLFRSLGLNVFIFDYRGYGMSRGRPSEKGTEMDARAAWCWLTEEQHIDPSRLIIFGRSLGAAVAAGLAAERRCAGLIVESGFTSYADIGAEHYPWLPVRLLAKYRYATAEKLARVRVPVLVVHSAEDELVPLEHGRALFEACAGPKQFLEIRGGHNDGFLISGEMYLQGLARFIDGVVP